MTTKNHHFYPQSSSKSEWKIFFNSPFCTTIAYESQGGSEQLLIFYVKELVSGVEFRMLGK